MSNEAYLRYYADTKRLCREAFPDLFFGDTEFADHMVLTGLTQPARYIRIRYPGLRPLHLRRIEIFVERDGAQVNAAPEATMAISSNWPNSEWLVQKKVFLESSTEKYGFHTEVETNPWVIVDLGQAEQISQIRLFNRTDEFAFRAWGIVLETSIDNETWTEEYDYTARETAFKSMLAGRRRHGADGPPGLAKMVLDDLLFFRHSTREIQDQFARLELEGPIRRGVFHVVNSQELFRIQLELTNHGVKQTFRFWSEQQKSEYIAHASEIIGALRAMGFEACLGYGGVLSVVRDQDMIPHDDDIDVIVSAPREAFPVLNDFIAHVGTKLREAGFEEAGNFVSHRHVHRPGWSASVDLFFGFSEGPFVAWYPGPRQGLLREAVFPPIACTFFGVEILIPRNPFSYLEHVYGPSWARPQPGWNHGWIESEYADWFQPPSQSP